MRSLKVATVDSPMTWGDYLTIEFAALVPAALLSVIAFVAFVRTTIEARRKADAILKAGSQTEGDPR